MTLPSVLRRPRQLAGIAFCGLLAVATWKLLEPNPFPEPLTAGLKSVSDVMPFLFSKSLHVCGYAVLAVLGWVAAPTARLRWAVVALLVLHGAGTEIGQTFVPHRTGKFADVLIDSFGIGLGTLTAWLVARTRVVPAFADSPDPTSD